MHILIADRRTLVRNWLKENLLHRYPVARIVEVSSISETQQVLASKAPELLILDLFLADGNAFPWIAPWRREHPNTAILVYSLADRHLYAARAMALGCIGFVQQDEPESVLIHALDGIGSLNGPPARRELSVIPGGYGPVAVSPFERLSDRELLVMQGLMDDLGIKEISQRMDLSPSTVATYKSRLFAKLSVSSVLELRRLNDIHRLST